MKSGKGCVPGLFSGKFWPPPAGSTFPNTCSAHQLRGDTSRINADIASQHKSTMRRSKSTAGPSTSPLGTSRLKSRCVAGVMRPCRVPERHIHTIEAPEAQSFFSKGK
ncbi:hypothetical protein BDZ91DRAFT_747815, partial [Kalaharituber pfeilii]